MKTITSLGFKISDLYQISFEEFLKKNPEYKKLSKDLRNERYILYEEERLSNIEKCIKKRKELINNIKKVDPKLLKKSRSYDGEEDSDEDFEKDYEKIEIKQKYGLRYSEDNYVLRKNYSSTHRKKFLPPNKIVVTENSYILNNSNGTQTKITQEELGKFPCIRNEKKKLAKKNDKKDDQLMRYLKVELDNIQKIKKVKERLNENDKKLKKFIKIKNKGLKQIDNERYEDHQKMDERRKIYDKILYNNIQKLSLVKQHQQEQKKILDLPKINNETFKKMEEINKQINDYEKKNFEYKQKIANLFELKDKDELKNLIKERNDQKKLEENQNQKETSIHLMMKNISNLKEKLEIDKYRRENALLTNMNKYQDKLYEYMEKSEEKEKRIKNALIKNENENKIKQMQRALKLQRIQNNKLNNEIKNETRKQELINEIEQKNLKDYAIKQEKLKIIEEKRKINKMNEEERKALKTRINEILNNENKNLIENDDKEKNEELIKKMINEKSLTNNQ